ncbi:spore coat protein YsxE [Shouchella shacheensis]|uniref:spore coat protein YsxE n=1 Tax=Shouchella shacheensis TaxID=1649580 RepID=UPI000740185D|nr:spore coat protein YsxE [Shouchella shacheensis]
MNQPYEAILFYYDIQPQEIEDLGKVKKVKAAQGTFALKETELNRLRADELVHAFRKLARLNYRSLIPILPTKFGEYTISSGQKSYYLMPWVKELDYTDRVSMEEKIADQMGVIHRLTVKTQQASKEILDQSCERLLSRWDMRILELKRFADQAEQKTYMSPFELTFLTHMYMFEQMSGGAKQHLEKWYESTLEKGTYRSVLTHGRLSRKHALFSAENQPLLFNFEQASLDTPARDLASFCRHSFPYALWSEEEVFRWFGRYEYHLPLLDAEKQLVCAYMLFPEPIYYAMLDYQTKGNEKSELEHVQRLEKRVIALRKVQRLVSKLAPAEEEEEG